MNKVRVYNILFGIIFIIGIYIMLYPFVSNVLYTVHANDTIKEYDNNVSDTEEEKKKEILSVAADYNKNNVIFKVTDIFTTNKARLDETYEKALNLDEDGIMGYLEIPKISINVPIYHGTSNESLNKGIGHLKGSSLPIGGEGTHAILAGHRGLPSAKLFTDLDSLEVGDQFIIHVLDDNLVYEVDKIDVIEPVQIETLQINDNGDYVTLVTCTPYAVNTHRLLVRGRRVQNDSLIIERPSYNKKNVIISTVMSFIIVILLGMILSRIIINTKKKSFIT